MPATLNGSCRCGAVRFGVQSHAPVPYQRCYCSICRKTGGGGGYAINLSAVAATLVIKGREAVGIFRAEIDREPPGEPPRCETATGERNFCTRCGSALWLFDPTWPDLLHPFASAIDGDLPVPPQRTHLMLRFKAGWSEPDIRPGDLVFQDYPEESIEAWHRRHELWVD